METVKHLCNPLLSNCNKAKFANISCVIYKGHAWSAFWKLDRVWKSPASLQQKVKLLKASALSVILYGCESWVLTSDVCSQLDFFQTSCLRIIGISRTDHVTNENSMIEREQSPFSQSVKARHIRFLVPKPRPGGRKNIFNEYATKLINPEPPPPPPPPPFFTKFVIWKAF